MAIPISATDRLRQVLASQFAPTQTSAGAYGAGPMATRTFTGSSPVRPAATPNLQYALKALTSGVSTRPTVVSQEQTELEKAKQASIRRVLSDPYASQRNPQQLIADLENIAQGKKKGPGGIFGFLKDVGEGIAGGAMYALGRPLALVTSVGKELSDIPSGGFSLEDLWKQALAKDTAPSKYLPKSGVKWLDVAIGLGADIVLDPTTWVMPAAKAFASRSGRIALAVKAAEASNLAKAPSLAEKVANGKIAKYGEWALDDFEREVLGVEKGLKWVVGGKTIGKEGTALRRASEIGATLTGKPLSYARGYLGERKVLQPLQKLTSLGSVKAAELGQYGRAGFNATAPEVFSRLAAYSSSMAGSSGGKLVGAKLAASHYEAVTNAAKHERTGGASMIDVIEGTVDPSQLTPQDLEAAQRVSDDLANIRTTVNDVLNETATRRGIKIIDVAHRDNYVPHVITDKAKQALFKLKKTDPRMRGVVDLLDVPTDDFMRSPGPLRARKVNVGDKFLGEEVLPIGKQVAGDSATIREMNRISNKVLGFDWFETDIASYMNSYLRSMQNQVARVKFIDRLYDFGTDVVDKLAYKLIPDPKVVKHWKNSEKFFNGMIESVNRSMYGNVSDVKQIAMQQRRIAEKVMLGKANEITFTEKQIGRIRQGIAKAKEQLALAEEAAKIKGGEIEQAFRTATEPHRARIQAIEDALAGNRRDEMIAQLQLEDMYRKTFPGAKKMPEDPMELAARVLHRTQSTTEARLKAQKTKLSRLKRTLGATGKVGRRENVAKQSLKQIRTEIAQTEKEVAELEQAFARSSEVFPEGYYFVRKSDVINPVENLKSAERRLGRNAGAIDEGGGMVTDTRGYMQVQEAGDLYDAAESSPEWIASRGVEPDYSQGFEGGEGAFYPESNDKLSQMGFVAGHNSDYVVTKGGVQVYTSIPEGEPMSRFMMVYAPEEPLEPGLGARILRPSDKPEDFYELVDATVTGIGDTIKRLANLPGLNREGQKYFDDLGQEFIDNWDRVVQADGNLNAIDPSFLEEEELTNIIGRAMHDAYDEEVFRVMHEGTKEQRNAVVSRTLHLLADELDGFLYKIADEPGIPSEIYAMNGAELIQNSLGNVWGQANYPTDVVGVDLRGIEFGDAFFDGVDLVEDVYQGDRIVLDSGYLARTIKPVPADSTLSKQGFRGGVDVTGQLMSGQTALGAARTAEAGAAEELLQASEVAAAKRAEKASAGRSIGGITAAQQKREQTLGELQGVVERARNEVVIGAPNGEVENLGSVAQAEGQIAASKAAITAEERNLQKAMATDPVMKEAARQQNVVKAAEAKLDAPTALLGEQQQWMETTGKLYQDEIDRVRTLVDSMPNSESGREATRQWLDSIDRTLASLESAPIDAGTKNALQRIITQTKGMEADLAMYESMRDLSQVNLAKAMTGELQGKVVNDLKKGFKAIQSMGVQVSPEIDRLLTRTVERLADPSEWNTFKKMWDGYNTFFKVSAMFTPGFIVRNGYTAAFNNFVAGVSLAETKDAMKFIRNVRKYGVDSALEKVAPNLRKIYQDGYQAVLGSGAGQTIEDILQPMLGKKGKVMGSWPVQKWAKANAATEETARFALALNGAKKGLGLDENVANIARYHFNYSDLSTIDEYAKKVIPFWIFASRNIPLQIVNQIARPAMYRSYDKLQKQMAPEEGAILPPWLAARGPLALPWDKSAYLNPDLPQLDMAEQIRMLTDPQRLVSQATPLIRLPIELMGNRQLALDIPFQQKPQEVRGPLDWPAYALMRAGIWGGQAGTSDVTGKPYVSQKASYALSNLIPSLATVQRTFPFLGGKENYTQRVGSSRWSTLGIPYRRVSPQEQADELTRREFAMKDYLSNLTRTGQLKPRTGA